MLTSKVWKRPDYTDPTPPRNNVVVRTPLKVEVKRATQFAGSGLNVKFFFKLIKKKILKPNEKP